MGKTRKDIEYFKFRLNVNEIILDPLNIDVNTEEGKELYYEIGQAIVSILTYYTLGFEIPSMSRDAFKNKQAQRFYDELLKSIDDSMDNFEVFIESGKRGGRPKK